MRTHRAHLGSATTLTILNMLQDYAPNLRVPSYTNLPIIRVLDTPLSFICWRPCSLSDVGASIFFQMFVALFSFSRWQSLRPSCTEQHIIDLHGKDSLPLIYNHESTTAQLQDVVILLRSLQEL